MMLLLCRLVGKEMAARQRTKRHARSLLLGIGQALFLVCRQGFVAE